MEDASGWFGIKYCQCRIRYIFKNNINLLACVLRPVVGIVSDCSGLFYFSSERSGRRAGAGSLKAPAVDLRHDPQYLLKDAIWTRL